ncbi:uncharacterized protein PAC_07537 [Phialocephala subalpina]|uniref:Uncharacterized protein n=1 Tax=Phialocephala subalpina TaxID=576137 RepID=A0A1L7WY04_9HELO|nr:uncharacterized protein PAC_07537 [Phialocephala subalpina]
MDNLLLDPSLQAGGPNYSNASSSSSVSSSTELGDLSHSSHMAIQIEQPPSFGAGNGKGPLGTRAIPLTSIQFSAENAPKSMVINGIHYMLSTTTPPTTAVVIDVGSASERKIYPYTLAELNYILVLVEELVGKSKRALSSSNSAENSRKLNAKFAGHKVELGDELTPRTATGPTTNGATKRKGARVAKDEWNIPERTTAAIQDYITRGMREEYNEICQRLVGKRDEMYGSRRSAQSKKRKVYHVEGEKSMAQGMGVFDGMMESGHESVPAHEARSAHGEAEGYQTYPPYQDIWAPALAYPPPHL